MKLRHRLAKTFWIICWIVIVFAWFLASGFAALAMKDQPPSFLRALGIYVVLWAFAYRFSHLWLRYISGPFVYAGMVGLGHIVFGKLQSVEDVVLYGFLTFGFLSMSVLFMVSSKSAITTFARCILASVALVFSMSLFSLIRSWIGIPICLGLLLFLVLLQKKCFYQFTLYP